MDMPNRVPHSDYPQTGLGEVLTVATNAYPPNTLIHGCPHPAGVARPRVACDAEIFGMTPVVARLEQQKNPRRRRRQESLAVLTQYEQPLR